MKKPVLYVLTIVLAVASVALLILYRTDFTPDRVLENYTGIMKYTKQVPVDRATILRQAKTPDTDEEPTEEPTEEPPQPQPQERDDIEVPPIEGEGVDRLISACKNVWYDWIKHGVYYSDYPVQTYTGNHMTQCSQYVYTAIIRAGYLNMSEANDIPNTGNDIHAYLVGSGNFDMVAEGYYSQVRGLIQRGDVVFVAWAGQGYAHVQIAENENTNYCWGGSCFGGPVVNGANTNYPENINGCPHAQSGYVDGDWLRIWRLKEGK